MKETQAQASELDDDRIKTGSHELDSILGGGFPINSINIIMGAPGCGKTILAERLVFANAEDGGRPILFLTTLSEPLEKILRYLQKFNFYDEQKIINGDVIYDSIGEDIRSRGVAALVPKLLESIKQYAPKIIVIDSFKAIHDLSESMPEMRRMLFEVSALMTAADTTSFLLGEYSEAMISSLPEFAVADGIVDLKRRADSTRDERYLSISKLRGSKYLEGLHAFRIGEVGLEVFPRLSSPMTSRAYVERDERIPIGVRGLDKLLEGGLWAGTAAMVQGTTGSGKTTLGLQFILAGLQMKENGLYVNFQENPVQLARQIRSLGWDLDKAHQEGLHCLYKSPVELQIDSILVKLFQIIEKQKIKRVVIDAVGDLASSSSEGSRLQGYLYALAQQFSAQRVSSLMTLEIHGGQFASAYEGYLSPISDVILRLAIEQRAKRVIRTLRIVKARGTNHDLNVHELRICSKGVEVL